MTHSDDPIPDEREFYDEYWKSSDRDIVKLCRAAHNRITANHDMIGYEACGPGERVWLWSGGDVTSVNQELYNQLYEAREEGCLNFDFRLIVKGPEGEYYLKRLRVD